MTLNGVAVEIRMCVEYETWNRRWIVSKHVGTLLDSVITQDNGELIKMQTSNEFLIKQSCDFKHI